MRVIQMRLTETSFLRLSSSTLILIAAPRPRCWCASIYRRPSGLWTTDFTFLCLRDYYWRSCFKNTKRSSSPNSTVIGSMRNALLIGCLPTLNFGFCCLIWVYSFSKCRNGFLHLGICSYFQVVRSVLGLEWLKGLGSNTRLRILFSNNLYGGACFL